MFSVPSVSWLKVFPEVSITKLSPATAKVRFGGDTWSFRSQFTECGIPGRYEDSGGHVLPSTAGLEEKKSAEYVRLIKSINVEEDVPREFLKNIFGTTLYGQSDIGQGRAKQTSQCMSSRFCWRFSGLLACALECDHQVSLR